MARASTIPIFEILLPTTLPAEISGWPDNAASTLTTSSGADVPKETTVSAITSLDNLK